MEFCSKASTAVQGHCDNFAYPYFAFICIDANGVIRLQYSQTIDNSSQASFSPILTETFQRALEMSKEEHWISTANGQLAPVRGNGLLQPAAAYEPYEEAGVGIEMHKMQPKTSTVSVAPAVSMADQQPWYYAKPNFRHFWKSENSENNSYRLGNKRATLFVRDRDILRRYYAKAFENLQQINCRTIAKAYVKLVDPRKQFNYPYNGRKVVAGKTQQYDPEVTKPPWWPSGVRHREPDHLFKVERVRLLVHILCEMSAEKNITVKKLKGADNPIRHQILPVSRLHILDEVYHVRQEEINFLEGSSDGLAPISVCNENMPRMATSSSQSGQNIPIKAIDTTVLNSMPAKSWPGTPPVHVSPTLLTSTCQFHANSTEDFNHNSQKILYTLQATSQVPSSFDSPTSVLMPRGVKRKCETCPIDKISGLVMLPQYSDVSGTTGPPQFRNEPHDSSYDFLI